jgi:hypothetical protein
MKYIGLDLHKKNIFATVLDGDGISNYLKIFIINLYNYDKIINLRSFYTDNFSR